jgi:hypothetical protein
LARIEEIGAVLGLVPSSASSVPRRTKRGGAEKKVPAGPYRRAAAAGETEPGAEYPADVHLIWPADLSSSHRSNHQEHIIKSNLSSFGLHHANLARLLLLISQPIALPPAPVARLLVSSSPAWATNLRLVLLCPVLVVVVET